MKGKPYYHVPIWMALLVDGLLEKKLACRLDTIGPTDHGTFRFESPCGDFGDNEGFEEELVVWSAKPDRVRAYLNKEFSSSVVILAGMAEAYAKNRAGKKDTYVHRCIVQLMIARAVELHSLKRSEPFVITGDFSLIGRLPENGKLQINGTVEKVEGWAGTLLEVRSGTPPRLDRRRSEYEMVSAVHKIKDGWVVVTKEPPNKFYF